MFAGDNFMPPTDGSYSNLIWESNPRSKGILIAGGVTGLDSSTRLKSAELFNPNTGETCSVGDLPKITLHFSSCNNLKCGGAESRYV